MDVVRWVDRHLIRFTKRCTFHPLYTLFSGLLVPSRFAAYRKGDASSFTLPETLSVYPQFMFHLRRGVLVSYFGSSPDETVLLNLRCYNILMIFFLRCSSATTYCAKALQMR